MRYPNFHFETKLWKKGFKYVGGADEVGRGCLAGPVVCGVVVFDKQTTKNLKNLKTKKSYIKINDSKKVTTKQREIADKWIKENCLTWGVGIGTVTQINKKGIVGATASGFRRAVLAANERLNKRIDFILFDAFYIPYIRGLRIPIKSIRLKNKKILRRSQDRTNKLKDVIFCGNQLAIVNGDEKSVTIGAASIIAKVYRDKLMLNLSKRYKEYGWRKNKGYGTGKHINAIRKFGKTRYHRVLFLRNIIGVN